jgi:hypothetical protein
MPGLDARTHVFFLSTIKDVDGRATPGFSSDERSLA